MRCQALCMRNRLPVAVGMNVSSTHPGRYSWAGTTRTDGFVAASEDAGEMVLGCGGSLGTVQRPLRIWGVVYGAVDSAEEVFRDHWVRSAADL